jgi:hypothetical protein
MFDKLYSVNLPHSVPKGKASGQALRARPPDKPSKRVSNFLISQRKLKFSRAAKKLGQFSAQREPLPFGTECGSYFQTLAIKYCIADGTCNIFCNIHLLLSGTLAF